MRVNFLGASDGTPLSKTFQESGPDKSYPNVAKFTSIERDINSLEDFYSHVVACSAEGLCLLKGMLDSPLLGESRAGHTDSAASTSWMCLDVDYTVTDQTPSEFLDMLNIKDVDYIFQKSASMGIKQTDGWRGHFFILLDSPQSPPALKQWLIASNLACTSLFSQIELSASGGALIYPLDVTTCQNDKLLYIAPPTCIGMTDPIEDRFELVVRGKRTWSEFVPMNAAANQVTVKKAVVELRKTQGLEPKKFKVTEYHGHDVLTNPDPVTVTSKKEERGFVYLNLNGGDSWAYYFPEEQPEILFNFKGEPCMYMRDVDRDIYNGYKNRVSEDSSISGCIPFGFLWPLNDSYYRGFANPDTRELAWLHPIGSKQKLRDFFLQNGVDCKTTYVVDEWSMEFDPTIEGSVNFTTQHINTYKQTKYMLNAGVGTKVPAVINHVLTSVCVNNETKNYFLNWLAHIFQTRRKTNTAWILQGVQGTGKGVLFTHILAPLMGRDYCHEMTMDRLDDDFNEYLNENFILFIDEANISDSKNGDRLLSRIKNLVTEPEQHIRGMRRNAVIRKNYSNIILASNHDEIISMEISDRRFNVAPRQEHSIELSYEDIAGISGELSAFADYLHSYEVDAVKVQTVLLSEARDKLIKLSETTVDAFFHSVRSEDLVYFTQFLDSGLKTDIEGIRYHDYARIVNHWMNSVLCPLNISRDDLRTCYQYLQNTTISTTKFSRICSKYGLEIKPVKIGSKTVRGIPGQMWHLSAEEREYHEEEEGSNVIGIKEHA
jgi:hypothetical protein